MSSESPKRAIIGELATLAKAFSNPVRLELIELLAQGERSVDSLAHAANLSVGNASQHLLHLRRCGVLLSRRSGKHVLYRLSDSTVVEVMAALRRLAERQVAEVQRVLDGYFHDRDSLEPISRKELLARLKDGGVVLLDVRPQEEYVAGHLPSALNIPIGELKERLRDLPADKEIVAYCRGPYCVFSFEAVAILRKRGFAIRRLEDGYPEWQVEGYPVEQDKAAR